MTLEPSIFVLFCKRDTPLTLYEMDRCGLPAAELSSPLPVAVDEKASRASRGARNQLNQALVVSTDTAEQREVIDLPAPTA